MKWVRRGVSIAGKVIGGLVIFSPAIGAYQAKGFSADLPDQIAYNYTGYSSHLGTLDPAQSVRGIGAVAVGVILMKVLSWAARSF